MRFIRGKVLNRIQSLLPWAPGMEGVQGFFIVAGFVFV